MDAIRSFLSTQYDLITESRAVLLEYCGQLSTQELNTQNSSFGRGSVSNLLVHIGNTYLFWIGEVCMKKEMAYLDYGTIISIQEIHHHFSKADMLMTSFLKDDHRDMLSTSDYSINGVKGTAPNFKIITHVLTHEFHHKGQILSLTRHLGYVPVDTDIMR
ncbi:MAG TPA: DinB family protein [Aquaticitalea sp.]|nr:DinB family protein [Aquaticitalea sp.]